MQEIIHIDYVIGFNVFLAAMFFLLFHLCISRKDSAHYLKYLGWVMFIVGVTRVLKIGDLLLEQETILLTVDVLRTPLLLNIPVLIILVVMSYLDHPEEREALERRLVFSGLAVSAGGALFHIVFHRSVVLLWALNYFQWILIFSAVVIGAFLFLDHARQGGKMRYSNRILVAFLLMNSIIYPFVAYLHYHIRWMTMYYAVESVLLGLDALVILYLVLYIETRHEMEEAQERYRRDFRSLMKYAGDGVALLDMDGRIVSANRTLARMLGTTRERLRDMNVTEVVTAEARTQMTMGVKMASNGSAVRAMRHVLKVLHPDKTAVEGSPRPVTTLSPISGNGEDGVSGILMVSHDLTPFLEYRTEQRLRKKAEERAQLQGILTSVIPFMLLGVDPVSRRVYLDHILTELEKNLLREEGYSSKVDMANHVCWIMNNIGGDFEWRVPEGKEGPRKGAVTVIGHRCPWGEGSRKNPFLCHLCKGIFTRLVVKDRPEAGVDLVACLANRDEECVIRISDFPVSPEEGNEDTGDGMCGTAGSGEEEERDGAGPRGGPGMEEGVEEGMEESVEEGMEEQQRDDTVPGPEVNDGGEGVPGQSEQPSGSERRDVGADVRRYADLTEGALSTSIWMGKDPGQWGGRRSGSVRGFGPADEGPGQGEGDHWR